MELGQTFNLSLQSLKTNKLRTLLTILGVVVGIFSIIVIMTIITILQKSIESGVSQLGKNTFSVQKYPAVQTGGPEFWEKYRNRKDLTIEEFNRLQEQLQGQVKYVGAIQGENDKIIKYGNKETNPTTAVAGITTGAFKTYNVNIDEGREISENDVNYSANVCVLGKDLRDKLFENVNPIGKYVRVDTKQLLVVGTLEGRPPMFGQTMDNFLLIPFPTFQAMYGRTGNSIEITVQSFGKQDYNEAIEAVIGALRTIRKVPAGQDNDFEILSNESILSQLNDITSGVKIGAMVISIIALLAAGVGIMNIMLVSVTERTREIGVRKAIGAKKKDVLIQFIIEAIVLCLIGGFIGITIGVGLGNVAGIFLHASAAIPYDWVLIGLGLCLLVGIVFGTYPAYKAANLDPIEALRFE
jgi:putative ABC transport system permease protein